MNAKRWGVLLAVLAVVLAYHLLNLGQYFSLDALQASQQALSELARARPLALAGAYFAAYVLMAMLSLPGAALMTLAAGALFGLGWGVLIVSFASSLGATLAFLTARFLLRDFVTARFGDRLAAFDAGVRRDGPFYLFTLRLIPVFPCFLVNLLFGLSPMKTSTFYWTSQLGMLAGTVVYVNAGTRLTELDSLAGILSPALIASFALLGLFPLLARKFVEIIQMNKAYSGWTKPRRFDRNLVVIGAGSAGLVTAYIAAAVRAKVTLVEGHKMGGDCLNTGCVPSKALIRSAKLLSQMTRAAEFGIAQAEARFHFAEVMERVQRVVAAVAPHDSVARYTELGVEVVEGNATIVSPWAVEITRADGTTTTLSTRSIVVATGARPFVPPIPGLDTVGYLTSDTVWDLRELPRRLVVLGGGPIGSELTQAFARLGAAVTQVEMGSRIMAREDPEVSALVMARFQAEGVDVRVDHRAKAFVIEHGEKILIAEHAGSDVRIPFDAVLVAVGRAANLTGFGLEALGIDSGRTIATNDFLQTTRFPNIYAAGDVAGPYQFTHTAAHQAWYAAVNALFAPFKTFRADYAVIPWATFVEPEVARVGLNELEAQERGIAYEVARYDIDDLDRAIADGEAHGFIKVLTVPGKDRILGVTIVGEHAGDLIAEYVLAMKHGIGLNKILGTIHIYPTLAEANKYVAGVWKRAHAPARLLRWVEKFHTWRRGA